MYSHRADAFSFWDECLPPADILNRAFVRIQHTPEQKERLIHSPEEVAAMVPLTAFQVFSIIELDFVVDSPTFILPAGVVYDFAYYTLRLSLLIYLGQ